MSIDRKKLDSTIEAIKKCALAKGGFSATKDGGFRPDVTAWAIIALRGCGDNSDLIQSAQRRLVKLQGPDGRVSMSQNHPDTFWPGSLAILAWLNEPEFENPLQLAANFLLSVSGTFFAADKIIKHNTSLKGWPWNENTHSWVVPSSMCILALKACGYGNHPRIMEAAKLLIDRQLPGGGWNYGNTIVFEKELLANPECSGHALNALSGYVESNQVATSIQYLKKKIVSLRSPLSLAWSIMGLSAWSSRPKDCEKWVIECIDAQNRYGNYSADLLSQIVVAYYADGGLLSVFNNA